MSALSRNEAVLAVRGMMTRLSTIGSSVRTVFESPAENHHSFLIYQGHLTNPVPVVVWLDSGQDDLSLNMTYVVGKLRMSESVPISTEEALVEVEINLGRAMAG